MTSFVERVRRYLAAQTRDGRSSADYLRDAAAQIADDDAREREAAVSAQRALLRGDADARAWGGLSHEAEVAVDRRAAL
jgi:hypothetical protein